MVCIISNTHTAIKCLRLVAQLCLVIKVSLEIVSGYQVKGLLVEMAANEGSAGRKLAATSPKSQVPVGAIPRRANFVLGGLAG